MAYFSLWKVLSACTGEGSVALGHLPEPHFFLTPTYFLIIIMHLIQLPLPSPPGTLRVGEWEESSGRRLAQM